MSAFTGDVMSIMFFCTSALVVPATRRSTHGYRAFALNSLPEFVIDCSSPLTVKKYLKTFI